jgi:D-sedoheptulose 7-phosphate isomerase
MHRLPRYLETLKQLIDKLPQQALADTVAILLYARTHGNRVFFMGNGGSGSTAGHFATDLGKGTEAVGLPRFKVMSLNDNMSTFSAYANDLGYEHVFAEQLKAFITRGDIVIGLSGSGNSRNVLEAMKVARNAGGVLIGMTGFDGGLLKQMVDLNLHAPTHDLGTRTQNMGLAEDAHHIMMHLICELIRSAQPDEYALPAWVEKEAWGLRVRRVS